MGVSASTVVRADLVKLIEQELLGPRNGPEEEIRGTPRAAYALGGLAPVTVDPSKAVLDQGEDTGADPNETGRAVIDIDPRAVGQRGVPVNTDEEPGTAEDDEGNDEGPKGALTHPSSMGIRFQVPHHCPLLRVSASWGRYEQFRRENDEGKKQQWSRRTDVVKSANIDVRDVIEHTERKPIDLDEDVSLRVELFPTADRMIVELALSNDRETGLDAPPGDWLFQTRLHVEALNGEAVFLPSRDVLLDTYDEDDPERQRLDMQYRHRLEFAVGRTCSATWSEAGDGSESGGRRATSVTTTWLPTADIPQTIAGSAGTAVTAMRELAELEAGAAETAFAPLVEGYATWLDEQVAMAAALPEHLREVANEATAEARLIADRLRTGVALLGSNLQTLTAFRFMNRAMREQRIRSQVAALRAATAGVSVDAALAEVEAKEDEAASWRPFQLAFILLQLPALTDPGHQLRSGDAANVELLFFPTGGGKTEAYLGLAAYTFAIRRLQTQLAVDGEDGEDEILDGGDGVGVLMRYTLRLLTSQQFQRAAALICAAELIRQEDAATWGTKPFTIGLWVGTNVSPKRYKDAEDQVKAVKADDSQRAYGLTALQIKRCPWCGTPIDPKRDVDAVPTSQQIVVHCGDREGDCPFSRDGHAEAGIPILTVDDEIYRHPPTFLLATVDKFARLAREGEAASLFGYVTEWCPRHGYRHPDARGDTCKGQTHNAVNRAGVSFPSVAVQRVHRLRPPDLIIQDELHLITGALGTAVGVFENAVDLLSSYHRRGQLIRPLVVASTATVRNAEAQVRALYGRGVDVFPPQVLDVRNTFFSREIAVTEETPGRKYLGICAHGIRLTLAEIRISEVLLLAGQKLLDEFGDAADPYMTTVGYFSATRELAGMRRYLDDDVTTRVTGNTEPFPRRTNDWARLLIGELTSRISSEEIAGTLDQLALEFDASRWSTPGKAAFAKAFRAAREAKKETPSSGARPYDVVLATSMLQVGVDVPRLGLMLVVGQPKNTAEYIQASSRVGRDAKRPGLVVSLANWARPRDMAHFEQFRHYHETFYAQVEALSVTPYSETALERGLTGVLVSVARVSDVRSTDSLSPEKGAGRILTKSPFVARLIGQLVQRAAAAATTAEEAAKVEAKLKQRLDRWYGKADEVHGALVYERSTDKNVITHPMLLSPETHSVSPAEKVFVVANSMREVQPEINLLVSPSPDRLAFREPVGSPIWEFPEEDA
jgi:hypothetical protein